MILPGDSTQEPGLQEPRVSVRPTPVTGNSPFAPGWKVVHSSGPAAPFHGRDVAVGTGREVWVHRVDQTTLVLGSTQPPDAAERAVVDATGLAVTTRRSGGGAVLVEPGGSVWVDVVVPPDDPLWDDDVGRSAHWLGRTWARAIGVFGFSEVAVHTGPVVATTWSRQVCFAGLGPGEVTVGGRKVVGISQRRTRAGARFQTVALLRWSPGPLVASLRMTPEERAAALVDLDDRAAGLPIAGEVLLRAFLAALPT